MNKKLYYQFAGSCFAALLPFRLVVVKFLSNLAESASMKVSNFV